MRQGQRLGTFGCAIAGLAALFASATTAGAENWPHWRGPRGNGVSEETGIASQWSPTKNIAWQLELPGPAGATPVVWDDNIFLTSVSGNDLVLWCVGTDGQKRWERKLSTGNKNVRRDEGNSASPSPTTDGKHVWAFVSTGDLACYDFEGNEVWKVNLQERYGHFRVQFVMSSSPVLFGDRLYLQVIHGDYKEETKEAYVVALDKMTGNEVWKVPRDTGAYGENEHSYASPLIYDYDNRRFLLTHGGDYGVAYNLDDGRELWRCGGLNPHDPATGRYHTTLRFVASPGISKDLIVLPSAKNYPVIGLRPDVGGDLTDNPEAIRWKRPSDTPDVPTPLIHDGLVYLCRENGNLLCLDAMTGEEFYNERTVRDRHRASPVYCDGKVYLTARNGKVSVIQAGKTFKRLGENDLGEEIAASPVISNGTLYLRTSESLWAIREAK
jgi:outer membrane protein assembly factor BamB